MYCSFICKDGARKYEWKGVPALLTESKAQAYKTVRESGSVSSEKV
jgi:hypothetical protein